MESIKDAEELLAHFDTINKQTAKPEPGDSREVLKRAGLILAVTAWETYVEDILQEIIQNCLRGVQNSQIGEIVTIKLEDDLKRLNTPDTANTKRLFKVYIGNNDITVSLKWNNYTQDQARLKLDDLIKKRGSAAHRSRIRSEITAPHLVTVDELRTAIRFFKDIVTATDSAL